MPKLANLAAIALAVLVGHLTDATTGQPLPNVHVTLSRPGQPAQRTTTSAAGAYRFGHVAPGSYTLSITSSDVPPRHYPVTVASPSTKRDIQACSTTLDYSCGGSGPGPGG